MFSLTAGFGALTLVTLAGAAPVTTTTALEAENSAVAMFSMEPAMQHNFADPAIITDTNGMYWAFATDDQVVVNNAVTGSGVNVQVANSSDFTTWTYQAMDVLPDAGNWTSHPSHVWAPDVVQLDNGLYVLYYAAAPSYDAGTHCIGAATASCIQGPYTPMDEPLHCAQGEGGAIDPSGFRDPATGKRYVMWKVDGNAGQPGGVCGNENPNPRPTPIRIQEVDPADGTTKLGGVVQILDRDEADGPLVEAPSMAAVPHPDGAAGYVYILFFSSNCYLTSLYDVSYATSLNGPLNGIDAGPVPQPGQNISIPHADFEKTAVPLLMTDSDKSLLGPGGLDVDVDGQHVVFHSAAVADDPGTRTMRYGRITVNGTIVTI